MSREGAPARRYPVQSMGCMEVARVVESRTPAVAVGDVVALNQPDEALPCAAGYKSAYGTVGLAWAQTRTRRWEDTWVRSGRNGRLNTALGVRRQH